MVKNIYKHPNKQTNKQTKKRSNNCSEETQSCSIMFVNLQSQKLFFICLMFLVFFL